MTPLWPRSLWVVRHGQSAGNAARDEAEAAGLPEIPIAGRDIDVPLSPLGERQAHALGSFFAALAPEDRPTVLLTSPYTRARETARIALGAAGIALPAVSDERLREREFGWLNGLTRRGIQERFPFEAERRASLGKFYHRPPGGESWCDVFLRARSFVQSISLEYPDERVLIVAHQVVVLALRYLLEKLNEDQILAIDRAEDVANCAVTSYVLDRPGEPGARLVLRLFNHIAPVVVAGEEVTRRPDVPLAPR